MLNLTEKLNNWDQTKDWFDGTWNEMRLKGNKYGLKLHHTAFALFYNKDYFKQAGLDPEQPPKTMTDFVEVVNKLGKKLPDKVKAFGFDSDPQYTVPFLITDKTPYIIDKKGNILVDNNQTRNILSELKKVIDSGNALIPDPAATYQVTRRAFIDEKIAMVITGPWTISNIRKLNPDLNYGVTMVPYPAKAKPKTLTAGTALAIPEGSSHPELAWKFVQGITEPEVEIQVTKNVGMLMPRKTWANDPAIKNDQVLNDFADLLPETSSFFLNSSKLGLSRIHWSGDLFSDFYQSLLYSEKTADEVLNQFIEKSRRYIKRELSR